MKTTLVRRDRGSGTAGCIVLSALLLAYVLIFAWEYTSILPQAAMTGHNSWFDGFMHGIFAVPNFFVNLITGHAERPLWQLGGSGWYGLCFVVGFTASAYGGSSSRK